MSSNASVNILLSTYNGEKYLSLLLDSLLAQTYHNITIYIRDDGSTDGTKQIIQSYWQESERLQKHKIVLIDDKESKNLGFMESFWTLLRTADAADYYAFCDQDDYWMPDKVERGVRALEKEDSGQPLLYSASFMYCDEDLSYSGSPVQMKVPIQFKDVLFYTPAFGFTVMLNRVLRDIALSASSLKDTPHDRWCQMIAASMGKFIYDPAQTAKYRRHSATVTYADSDKMQLIGKWLKNDILGIGLTEYRMVLRHFYEEYAENLQQSNRRFLDVFMEESVHVPTYLKRLFFPQRLRPSLGGETALRLCFLLNR